MSRTDRKWLRNPSERVGTLSHADLPPPHVPDEDERMLLRALRARDETAFEALLERWHEPMFRAARAHVRTAADAEEVVQDTWLALLRGIDSFESRSSLRTWIFRVLANRARTRARREARTVPLSAFGFDADEARRTEEVWPWQRNDAEPDVWHGVAGEDPHEALAGEDLKARIERVIAGLPGRQREVITLRDLEGWSAAEVCDAMAISEANQRVLLHRARARVREALAPMALSA